MNKRVILALGVVGLAAMAGGCTSTQPASGATGEVRTNEVTGNVGTLAEAGLDRSMEAARAAVAALQFTTKKDSKDALKGVIEASTADDKSVTITVTKVSENTSRVDISAGPLNKGLAQTVMAKFRESLK
jgi:hypothetical protein